MADLCVECKTAPAIWCSSCLVDTVDDTITEALRFAGEQTTQALHALRLGLYAKIKQEELTIPQARVIFESVRGVLIKHLGEEQKKEKPSS